MKTKDLEDRSQNNRNSKNNFKTLDSRSSLNNLKSDISQGKHFESFLRGLSLNQLVEPNRSISKAENFK